MRTTIDTKRNNLQPEQAFNRLVEDLTRNKLNDIEIIWVSKPAHWQPPFNTACLGVVLSPSQRSSSFVLATFPHSAASARQEFINKINNSSSHPVRYLREFEVDAERASRAVPLPSTPATAQQFSEWARSSEGVPRSSIIERANKFLAAWMSTASVIAASAAVAGPAVLGRAARYMQFPHMSLADRALFGLAVFVILGTVGLYDYHRKTRGLR